MPQSPSLAAEITPTNGSTRARVVARRYHLHLPGLVYAAITVLLVVGAVQGQNNLLMWVFSLAVAGLVLSGVLSGSILMRLDIERRVIGAAQAGHGVTIEYVVRNRSWIPAMALVIEEMPAWRRGRHASTWREFMPGPGASIACVPAKGVSSVRVVVRPWKRGVATLDAFRVLTTFPFGLTLKSVVYSQRSSVRVRPWTPTLVRGAFLKLLAPSERAERNDARRGVGQEFFSLRDYVAGDSPRSIAWRATAKRGELVVRETAARRGTPVTLLVDASGDAERVERVISLAGSLAREAGAGAVPLAVRAAGVSVAATHGTRQADRVLDVLVDVGVGAGAEGGAPRERVVVVTGNPARWDGYGVASIDDAGLVPASEWASMPKVPDGSRSRLGFLRRLWGGRARA